MSGLEADTRPDNKHETGKTPSGSGPIEISGTRARQGEIILSTAAKRFWFIGVLVFCILALVVLGFVL